MNKTIVVYYSSTGSNRYVAERIARTLNCDIEPIRPWLSPFFFVFLSSALKRGLGIQSLRHSLKDYDKVILCGPIWMGMLVAPLRDFVRKYGDTVRNLYFVTCCGSSDAMKDDKFGHEKVFTILRDLAKNKNIRCEAFPVTLVVPKEKIKDSNAIMKTRLSDDNFSGDIVQRFDAFIRRVSSGQ